MNSELEELFLEICKRGLDFDFADLLVAYVSPDAFIFGSTIELDSDKAGFCLVTGLAMLHIDIKIRLAKECLARNIKNRELI